VGRLDRPARRRTDYCTGGKGRFVMSAMEDSGIPGAVGMLGRMTLADPSRAEMSSPDYIAAIQKQVPATREALAAAYLVGKAV
jgi:hypothetical protein